MMTNNANKSLFENIKHVLDTAKQCIARNVNFTMVEAYWQIGKHIVEYEQQGDTRAEYGKKVIEDLSSKLMKEYGSGFTVSNIKYMRQFYKYFPIRHALRDQLSWTHYRTLLKIQDDDTRQFYINECIQGNWSTRQLERQINTLFCERLLSSNDKQAVREEIQKSEPTTLQPKEIIRDPYILEFLGIPQGDRFLENDLEQLLINKLQHLLLEMGKGFSFVSRQKRITLDNQHFYIDLVFYNYLARCFVLVDLKADRLTHQDIGQMQMYVNYYTRELMNPGDNPPVGIILCTDKSEAVVKYTLSEDNKQIFASQYLTYLPSEEELKMIIEKE